MKTTLSLLLMMCFFLTGNAQTSPKTFNLVVGTYTNPGKSNGMYVYSFNSGTGELTYKAESAPIKNPSYLTVSTDRKHIYAVSEVGDGKESVNAFSFDPASGKITFINSASTGGNGPCYVSVDSKNKTAFVGNYGGGSLAAVPINPDGSLSDKPQFIKHAGSSVKSNQEKPHVHATVLSNDDRYLFVPDLGTDKVNIYQVTANKAEPLTPAAQPFASVTAGSGPRHFVFHPNGKWAYLIQEMTGAVTAFDYTNGQLKSKASVSLPASGAQGKIDAADIHISPDGKFLYGSLRGDQNEIVACSIDKSGGLAVVGRQSTLGKTPRNFAIDPTGNFLLVGNQNSDNIIVFKRDQKTGLLSATNIKISIGAPVCLKFVAVN
ncbi:lactonase family protein [Chryseolinea soli]|uniref:Lactonase family protein n=1 Tax=Chryseolinea soli TaxID=2321403 RepID=A0A385SJ57_9BACT|nr:lactonase family protein [Chryseolinea soli]AYB29965.1 lactonase family protein [Chryseolinea soli]